MLFETHAAFAELIKHGNHVEILPLCTGCDRPGQFATHVDDATFYGLIEFARRNFGKAAWQLQKKFFKEVVYRDITQQTNELHQSRIFQREVKNVHETEVGDCGVLVVVYERQRLGFAGFPSNKNVHSDCYLNTAVFPIGSRVHVHFERRQMADGLCFNKVYISYDHDARDARDDVHVAMDEINAIFERLVCGVEMLSAHADALRQSAP